MMNRQLLKEEGWCGGIERDHGKYRKELARIKVGSSEVEYSIEGDQCGCRSFAIKYMFHISAIFVNLALEKVSGWISAYPHR